MANTAPLSREQLDLRGVSVTHLCSDLLAAVSRQPKRVRHQGQKYIVASRDAELLDLRLPHVEPWDPPSIRDINIAAVEVLERHNESSIVHEIEPLVIRPIGKTQLCPRDGRPGCAYVDAVSQLHPTPGHCGASTYMLS